MKDIELPKPVAHAHSDGEFCWDQEPVRSTWWPISLFTEDQLRAAVEADRAQRVPDVENILLRQMLALRIGGAGLYTDDGELQDNSVNPCIDFKRDSAELIHYKLKARLASTPAPAQQEPSEGCDPHWSYYFKVTECKAKTARDGDCICWHTEGTGPFDMVRHDDADQFLEWRESPSSAPAPAQQQASGYGPNLMPQVSGYGPQVETLVSSTAHHQEPPQQERKPMTYREIADATSEWAHVRSDYTIGIIRAAERHHGIKE